MRIFVLRALTRSEKRGFPKMRFTKLLILVKLVYQKLKRPSRHFGIIAQTFGQISKFGINFGNLLHQICIFLLAMVKNSRSSIIVIITIWSIG